MPFELVRGARLDRYELVCPLAEGGMATVWLARLRGKRGFEQLVALKTIKAHLSEDPRFEKMFLDEARIASRIRHPNVAQILDLGEEQGVLYLVMEWVDGDSLARLRRYVLKQETEFPLAIALRIIADACAGLHAAHELRDESGANLGVIHRDVSPQNVLVAEAGSAKVIDFGIAKAKNRSTAETTDGLLKGKVAYMSPEQAKGMKLDRRSDVWSIGVCLYELLTGDLPFDGESQNDIHKQLTMGAPIPELPERVPEVVRSVMKQALAYDRDARFHTAAAFQRALEGALASLGSPTTHDDVATFLRETSGKERAARREMVAAAIEKIDGITQDVARTPEPTTEPITKDLTKNLTPPVTTSSVDVRFSEPPVEAPTQMATEHSATPREKPRSRALPIALVGLVALVGVGWLAKTRVTIDAAPAPSIVPAQASAPATTSATSEAEPPPPAPPPTASTAPVASVSAKPPVPVVLKPRPKPAPSARSAPPTGPQYDPDGIPIVRGK